MWLPSIASQTRFTKLDFEADFFLPPSFFFLQAFLFLFFNEGFIQSPFIPSISLLTYCLKSITKYMHICVNIRKNRLKILCALLMETVNTRSISQSCWATRKFSVKLREHYVLTSVNYFTLQIMINVKYMRIYFSVRCAQLFFFW